ncbi:hypothetical protein ACWF99_23690 [Nocardia sp. NPDC055002]
MVYGDATRVIVQGEARTIRIKSDQVSTAIEAAHYLIEVTGFHAADVLDSMTIEGVGTDEVIVDLPHTTVQKWGE